MATSKTVIRSKDRVRSVTPPRIYKKAANEGVDAVVITVADINNAAGNSRLIACSLIDGVLYPLTGAELYEYAQHGGLVQEADYPGIYTPILRIEGPKTNGFTAISIPGGARITDATGKTYDVVAAVDIFSEEALDS